ncbi:ABC transporter ATP-binding protein [Agreia pratensis]|uniref:ATP-binding cassette domain-containing protein n=1 Tax=Agreia pratensis TaxID=150121 RepID=UPI00188D1E13|nr:ATP-binding cassette domain-containing protein [Agreia pratensis]MBF4635304.1 ABC transporter ATP-binding protein [Agreia pratensis]
MKDDPSRTGQPLLRVRDLVVEYPGPGLLSRPKKVLHGVNIEINSGETLGLVGESGSGKSTIGRALLGLAPVTGGTIEFDGENIAGLSKRSRRRLAGEIQVVFQDPYSSLNPSMTVGDILAEPLRVAGASAKEAQRRVRELLDSVHLPEDAARRYAREFSGGQRQRVAIARALSREPRLIVCDEPVSALDLSTQAHVLELFIEIQERTGVAYLFVTHDLTVVRSISHRVAVMRHGEIVETGEAEQVVARPAHPYTQKLLLAAPVPDPQRQAARRAARRELASNAEGAP